MNTEQIDQAGISLETGDIFTRVDGMGTIVWDHINQTFRGVHPEYANFCLRENYERGYDEWRLILRHGKTSELELLIRITPDGELWEGPKEDKLTEKKLEDFLSLIFPTIFLGAYEAGELNWGGYGKKRDEILNDARELLKKFVSEEV